MSINNNQMVTLVSSGKVNIDFPSALSNSIIFLLSQRGFDKDDPRSCYHAKETSTATFYEKFDKADL